MNHQWVKNINISTWFTLYSIGNKWNQKKKLIPPTFRPSYIFIGLFTIFFRLLYLLILTYFLIFYNLYHSNICKQQWEKSGKKRCTWSCHPLHFPAINDNKLLYTTLHIIFKTKIIFEYKNWKQKWYLEQGLRVNP